MAETGERLSNGRLVAGVSIRLAAADTIRNWSYGEVTKPETINYRSFKPERDGLFCEKIFGPVRNWECNCGKYKRIRYRGVVCDRCGVEVTHSRVRRERMGHIELAVPIVHIWFLRSVPSHIAYLLGLSTSDLDRIVYYQKYVVLDQGDTQLKPHQLIGDDEYEKLEDGKHKFVAKMGGEAVLEMLATVDLEELATDLRTKSRLEPSEQRRADHLKRLRVVEAFLKSGNNPEHMVLRVLPVLPPDLRPLVPLEGGRFATSDLNDLYRRVLNRNIRLKKLIEIKAPDVILRNEMRMLQEAVDTLFDNGRRSFSVKGEGKRPLKSLSDILRGKQGRFRQNLLGKRVDYSGRSVIVVGPELKIHQCGLPKTMALELFKPYVIQKLEERSLVQTVKGAKKYVEKERPEVWDILEEVIRDHPVLLNRAPTLHRLGIQAFFPVLGEGKAIRLHPLVCHAFNADFDGDQMAVHVPLSFESQLECRVLMLSANNLLSPADGRPVMTPTQDIVLGAYYLTRMAKGRKGSGRVFADSDEVVHALEDGQIDIHADIRVRFDGKLIETTAGRVLFNTIIPEGIGFRNELMKKGKVQQLVEDVIRAKGARVTCRFLDGLKDLGYEAATQAGITFGMEDLVVPREKGDIIGRANREVERIRTQYRKGILTEGERYNKIIDVWMHATNEVAEGLYRSLEQDREGFNPVFVMMNSEARGSKDQIKQLAGMRGLMQKPQKTITGAVGEIIENPIISSLKDGLSVLEYFISTHGARKGLADTALKTADAGYLTRRLVDVVQDVVVTVDDCHTTKGIEIGALREGDEEIEPLRRRIVGRVTKDEIRHPVTDEVICGENSLIDDDLAKRLEDADVETVVVRSVLTCEAERGTCQMCYGRNLATGKLVDVGETVGIMAAQSIGEPGTQLTLRTFHIGGTASRLIAQSREVVRTAVKDKEGKEGKEVAQTVRLENVESVFNDDAKGFSDSAHGEKVQGHVVIGREGEIVLVDDKGKETQRVMVPYGALLRVEEGQKVKKLMEGGQQPQVLCEWDPYNNLILTPKTGTVRYVDLKLGVTYREDEDRLTGERIRVAIDDRQKVLHAHIHVVGDDGTRLVNVSVPTDGVLQVRDGDKVREGAILVKLPRESARSRDITGGLPRVAELFEARRPKNSAVLTEIDGVVKFPTKDEERTERNNRVVFVAGDGEQRKYLIEMGKHLRVHEGDHVRAGDQLSEGAKDPHDILKIKGGAEVQKYLLNQIQAVYRLQGVTINDKHIEVIISQMLRKVRVESSGDTSFLEGDLVDRKRLVAENLQLEEGEKKGEPATFKPYLQGITKASLSTESFLSAASFQETTKVLSRAAVEGRTDHLRGLKENLIMGNLIPSGTGARMYRGLKVRDLETDTVEVEQQEPQGDFVDIGGELA